jgi:hypothetical protein
MLIVGESEVKLPGEAKQNNLPPEWNVDNRLTGAIMVANSPTGIQSGPHRWHFDLNISP